MVEMNIYNSRGTCTCRSSNEQFQRNNSSNGSGSNEIASPKSVKILSLLFANDTTYQLSGNNLNDQRIYSLKKLLNRLRQTNLP